MSSENAPNGGGGNGDTTARNRRSSITQAALSNLFQRGNSTSQSNGNSNDPRTRRLSVNTLGLSGAASNNGSFGMRRGSMSANSDSVDGSAIEDDDVNPGARTVPTTPFTRRMSMGGPAMRGYRTSGSPGNGNNSPTSPPPLPGRRHSGQRVQQAQSSSIGAALSAAGRRASGTMPASSLSQASNTKHPRVSSDNPNSRADQQGFNWSEQLRSRAESSVTGARPSFSLGSGSPPRGGANHDRAKSVSDMPQPPVQAAAVKPKQERPKPDAFQERILKGDFYMD